MMNFPMKIKTLSKRLSKDEKGLSILELAFIAPVMLTLMVGSLDMGAAFLRNMELANAVRAGTQYALVRKPIQGDLTLIKNAVFEAAGYEIGSMLDTGIKVELFCYCLGVKQPCTETCTDPNPTAHVYVSISETFKTPFFSYGWLGGDIVLFEDATVRLN